MKKWKKAFSKAVLNINPNTCVTFQYGLPQNCHQTCNILVGTCFDMYKEMPKNVRTCWHTTLSELPTPIFGIIYYTYLPSIHFLKHFEEVPFKKIQTKQKSYHPIITKNYMATATLDSSWDADICDDSGRHIWT